MAARLIDELRGGSIYRMPNETSLKGSWQRPDHVVAGVVGRPQIAGVLKPLMEPDFGELVLRPDVISAARVLRLGDRSIGTDHEVNFSGSCHSVVFGVQADDLAISIRFIPVDCDVVIGHGLTFRVDDAAVGRLADAGDDSPPGVDVTFDLFESDIAGRLVGLEPLRGGFVEDDTAATGHALS